MFHGWLSIDKIESRDEQGKTCESIAQAPLFVVLSNKFSLHLWTLVSIFFFFQFHFLPCSISSNSTQATFSKRVEMREQLLQVSSRRTQHVSIFFSFCLCFISCHEHFISFRFSMDFYSIFFFVCVTLHFESQLCLVVRLQQEAKRKKVPKTFPRCNICHVLYPVNWRFSIVIKQFFFYLFRFVMFARFWVIVVVVIVAFLFGGALTPLRCMCSVPYEISSFTWK